MIRSIHGDKVVLLDKELLRRREDNRKYLMKLSTDELLLHFRFEAGIEVDDLWNEDRFGGWESPVSQLRGHFLGHWLSGAAKEYSVTKDRQLLAKAEYIVNELEKCQIINGNGWCSSLPEKYLDLIARGRVIWAPQYTIHKTLMGLLDMYELADNQQALNIVLGMMNWFYNWAKSFTDDEFSKILDFETGGMLEIWSQLYGITKSDESLFLMNRYYRTTLFDALLRGEDVLTNMHANTTIPEILGAAKAYEVTGDEKWYKIVLEYWKQAVTERGFYSTGAQTNGEVWSPKMKLISRMGPKTQEHCSVYNMMRMADFLFRHTGDKTYMDYYERNLFNGVMAQTYYRNTTYNHGENRPYPETGLVSYFLPMKSGTQKPWSSKRKHFYCCHGTMVQANAGHVDGIYYQDDTSLYVNEYFASDVIAAFHGKDITILQRTDTLTGNSMMADSNTGVQTINEITRLYPENPHLLVNHLIIKGTAEFTVKIRIPWWQVKKVKVLINHKEIEPEIREGYIVLHNKWEENDDIQFIFEKTITIHPLPDCKELISFMAGPVVLGGLCGDQKLHMGDKKSPEELLVADNEREWAVWNEHYRTVGQEKDIYFKPLYEIGYEPFSVYFPVGKGSYDYES